VTVGLEENLITLPSHKEYAARFGPLSSFVFDSAVLSSISGGFGEFFELSGTVTKEANFAPSTFPRITKTLDFGTNASLLSKKPYNIDLAALGRSYSVETIFYVPNTTEIHDIWSWTDFGNTEYLVKLRTNNTSLEIVVNGTVITTLTSTIAANTAYHVVYTEKGSNSLGGFERSIIVNGGDPLVEAITETVHSPTNPIEYIKLGGDGSPKIAAINIYDKILNKETTDIIYRDLQALSFTNINGNVTDANIERVTVTDIFQEVQLLMIL
jgi:hypothetical protein